MSWIRARYLYFIGFYFSIAIVSLELGIRYIVLGEPRLFDYSEVTGWRLKPNLNIQRRDHYGSWNVVTDLDGNRSILDSNYNIPNWIILGDSFAFGEGVNIDQRFDAVNTFLQDSSINFGVPGYSPLQAFLRINESSFEINGNTSILLLVYKNDIQDSIQYHSAYRKRPILNAEDIIEYPNSFLDHIHGFLRDSSYVYYSLLLYVLKPDVELTVANFISNLRFITGSFSNEVHVVFHGFHIDNLSEYLNSNLCKEIRCHVFEASRESRPELYIQGDAHWNALGHKAFSDFLTDFVVGQLD